MTTTPWTNIKSVDYDNKRVHLHSDTVANGFDAIAAYFEIQALIQINANGEQNRLSPYLGAEGKIKKTNKPSYTPRFAYTKTGWRFVPYNAVSHRLSLLCEIVSEESLTDADVFDLSGLSVNVHIGSDYDQVEIIEINTGGSLTIEQDAKLFANATKSDVFNASQI